MKHLAIFSILSILLIQLGCSTNAAPTDAPKTKEKTSKSKPITKPKDIQTVDTSKTKLTLGMIEADGKYHVWMEGRSGILRVAPENTFWYKDGGISVRNGKGQKHIEIDGHLFYTPEPISTTTLSSKINNPPKNKSGYSISLEMTSKGKYITSIIPKNKRPIRISATKDKPARSAIISLDNPKVLWGKPTVDLSENEKNNIRTTGKPLDPKSIIPIVSVPEVEITQINTELKGIFGGIANVEWSNKLDLDGDKEDETIVCSPTPKFNTCMVLDTVNKQRRYYDTGFKWDGKQYPITLKIGEQMYLHHSSPLTKGAIHKILFFDGSGYNSTQL